MELNGVFLFFIILFVLLFLGILSTVIFNIVKKPSDSIEDYIQGLQAITDGDNRLAILKLKNAIRKNTENVEAYIRLGNLLRREGLAPNALKIHKELLLRKKMQKDQRGRLFLALADDYSDAGKNDLALKYLDLYASEIDNADPRVMHKSLNLYEKLKKWKKAHQLLKGHPGLVDDNNNRLALYKVYIGDKLVKDNKEKEARISYKEALKHEENNPAALLAIGDSYWREERREEARSRWGELSDKNPKYAFLAFDKLEKASFEMGEFSNMETFYQNLIRQHPEFTEPMIALSNIHQKKGEFDKSIQILEKVLKLEPENSMAKALRLKVLIKKGNDEEFVESGLEFLNSEFLKKEKHFICNDCGHDSLEALWHCPACGNWNSYV